MCLPSATHGENIQNSPSRQTERPGPSPNEPSANPAGHGVARADVTLSDVCCWYTSLRSNVKNAQHVLSSFRTVFLSLLRIRSKLTHVLSRATKPLQRFGNRYLRSLGCKVAVCYIHYSISKQLYSKVSDTRVALFIRPPISPSWPGKSYSDHEAGIRRLAEASRITYA